MFGEEQHRDWRLEAVEGTSSLWKLWSVPCPTAISWHASDEAMTMVKVPEGIHLGTFQALASWQIL